jgi:hypothetical protein
MSGLATILLHHCLPVLRKHIKYVIWRVGSANISVADRSSSMNNVKSNDNSSLCKSDATRAHEDEYEYISQLLHYELSFNIPEDLLDYCCAPFYQMI